MDWWQTPPRFFQSFFSSLTHGKTWVLFIQKMELINHGCWQSQDSVVLLHSLCFPLTNPILFNARAECSHLMTWGEQQCDETYKGWLNIFILAVTFFFTFLKENFLLTHWKCPCGLQCAPRHLGEDSVTWTYVVIDIWAVLVHPAQLPAGQE